MRDTLNATSDSTNPQVALAQLQAARVIAAAAVASPAAQAALIEGGMVEALLSVLAGTDQSDAVLKARAAAARALRASLNQACQRIACDPSSMEKFASPGATRLRATLSSTRH